METEIILCDTNIFIHWFDGNAEIDHVLRSDIGLKYIGLPSIVYMELLQGMGNKNELTVMRKRIEKFHIVDITEPISKRTREYIKTYSLSHKLQIPDAFIAATAVEYNLRLFTYNLKDFRFIPDIKLYQKE